MGISGSSKGSVPLKFYWSWVLSPHSCGFARSDLRAKAFDRAIAVRTREAKARLHKVARSQQKVPDAAVTFIVCGQ